MVMTDREKVIKGLECCKWSGQNVKPEKNKCDECPYKDQGIMNAFSVWKTCINVLVRDTLTLLKEQDETIKELQNAYGYLQKQFFEVQDKLLKEQEAVEPEVEVLNEIDRLYRCPKCHKHFFYKKQKYCHQCGQAVKWE